MKDWRGTEIEVGSRVITRSSTKWPTWRIGTVSNISKTGAITVDTEKSDSSWSMSNKKVPLWSHSVTVLTEDMFPDLVERVATLEGDIEYYKSEIVRTW